MCVCVGGWEVGDMCKERGGPTPRGIVRQKTKGEVCRVCGECAYMCMHANMYVSESACVRVCVVCTDMQCSILCVHVHVLATMCHHTSCS